MKKLIVIPIALICLTGASVKNSEPVRSSRLMPDNTRFRPDVKVDKLDSLLKKL